MLEMAGVSTKVLVHHLCGVKSDTNVQSILVSISRAKIIVRFDSY